MVVDTQGDVSSKFGLITMYAAEAVLEIRPESNWIGVVRLSRLAASADWGKGMTWSLKKGHKGAVVQLILAVPYMGNQRVRGEGYSNNSKAQ